MLERFKSIFGTTASNPIETGGRVVVVRADAGSYYGLNDPRLKELMRSGQSGVGRFHPAMKNGTVNRAVSLISQSIGMLPLHLHEGSEDKSKAVNHNLYSMLLTMPNNWQTAFEFKQLMQSRVLLYGNAYAYKVRSGNRIIRLVPIDPKEIEVKQNPDWSLSYKYTGKTYNRKEFRQDEIFHLRAPSDDGISGASLVDMAAEIIGLANATDTATKKQFETGVSAGGALKSAQALSDKAYDRLKEDMDSRYSGAENTGNFMILEEGLELQNFLNAKDAQQLETRRYQVEEVARVFGVPRPLLAIDETSWGSGISELGQLFVRFTLQPWFKAWEDAINRDLLAQNERERYYAKFNAGALTRGSLADQGEFFAKASGSGGHAPWMDQDEIRDLLDLPKFTDEQRTKLNQANGVPL